MRMTTAQGPVTLIGANETAVVTSDQLEVSNPTGEAVCIDGVMNITPGAGTTAILFRLRSGAGLGGPMVGMMDGAGHQYRIHTLAAGAAGQVPFAECDYPVSGTQQWTVTAQQVSATGNGTVNAASVCVNEPHVISGRV